MRTREYRWPLHSNPARSLWVRVYADRSVEMGTTHPDGYETRRADYLQTREEAAWFLRFARHDYAITRTWL